MPHDVPAIREVHRLAFAGPAEGEIVDALRAGGYSRLGLVAEIDGRIVGHILFSELVIVPQTGTLAALALAPLAVLPEYQRQGVGSKLTQRGLSDCRAGGHQIVVVLGHPAYYPRFGFSVELARLFETPYAGKSLMALELVPGAGRHGRTTGLRAAAGPPLAGAADCR